MYIYVNAKIILLISVPSCFVQLNQMKQQIKHISNYKSLTLPMMCQGNFFERECRFFILPGQFLSACLISDLQLIKVVTV